MAVQGDTFTVSLKDAHIDWGEHRNTGSRNIIEGEGYIAVPRDFAKKYEIFNSNHNPVGYGYNLFHASSKDGFLCDETLLAQGSSTAGDIYAKQFSVQGDLKKIGNWYKHCGATANNYVKVTFTSKSSILLEII